MGAPPFKRAVCASLIASLLAAPALARAESPPRDPDIAELKRRLDEQARLLAEQKRVLEQQAADLARQKSELRDLREQLGSGGRAAPGVSAAELERRRAAGRHGAGGPPPEPQAAPAAVAQAEPAGDGRVGVAPAPETRPPVVAPITDAVTVLTPPGKFVVEPSLQYAYSTDTRVTLVGFTIIPAITIGLIDVRSVNRDLWLATLTGRYGITDRLEVEAKIPWVYRQDSTLARPLATPSVTDTLFDADNSGLSDIELALRYQITQRPPFYIGFLRVKTRTGDGPFDVSTISPVAGLTIPAEPPTGTGFYAVQAGATALVPSDPAVFFGGLSYIWNIERTIDTLDAAGTPVGDYDPGDGVNFNFGMGLSINERASFSLGYDHSTFFKDERNGVTVLNAQTQQIGSLLFGLSYRLTPSTYLNLTLGVGATSAAPDVQITARLPIMF